MKRDVAYYKGLLVKQALLLESHARVEYIDKARGLTDAQRQSFLSIAQAIRHAIGEHRTLEMLKVLSDSVRNELKFLEFQKNGIDLVEEARKSHAGRVALHEFEKFIVAAAQAAPDSYLAELVKKFHFTVSKDPNANVLAFPSPRFRRHRTEKHQN